MTSINPTIKETSLYETLSSERVRCNVCERRCLLVLGKKGFCKTKLNVSGKLYTIVYGDISAVESRPIEIKPFFHYHPGSRALTISTWSCNFRCPWCQNHELSRAEPNMESANYTSPEKIVNLASTQDDGLCISFQEPTLLFEYSLDLFKKGRRKGLYCCWVSNGYLTSAALRQLKEAGLDGLKIDVKGGKEVYEKYCGGADHNIVWRNAREARKMGIHVEIVNLVITDVNDSEASLLSLIERHIKEVGTDTPLHFTRYFPAYKFVKSATKVETLEMAYNLAKQAGILYPYIGNVHGHKYENTYCPDCKTLLIERLGSMVVRYRINERRLCPRCKTEIPIVGLPKASII